MGKTKRPAYVTGQPTAPAAMRPAERRPQRPAEAPTGPPTREEVDEAVLAVAEAMQTVGAALRAISAAATVLSRAYERAPE